MTESVSVFARGEFPGALVEQAWTLAGASPEVAAKLGAGDDLSLPEAKQALSAVASNVASGNMTAAQTGAMSESVVALAKQDAESGTLSAEARAAIEPLLAGGWLPEVPASLKAMSRRPHHLHRHHP